MTENNTSGDWPANHDAHSQSHLPATEFGSITTGQRKFGRVSRVKNPFSPVLKPGLVTHDQTNQQTTMVSLNFGYYFWVLFLVVFLGSFAAKEVFWEIHHKNPESPETVTMGWCISGDGNRAMFSTIGYAKGVP